MFDVFITSLGLRARVRLNSANQPAVPPEFRGNVGNISRDENSVLTLGSQILPAYSAIRHVAKIQICFCLFVFMKLISILIS